VDAESIVLASLRRLEALGKLPKGTAAKAISELGIDATKKNPLKD
jgi:pyruvate dehydrogenase complex dehydrogenase (E1) component